MQRSGSRIPINAMPMNNENSLLYVAFLSRLSLFSLSLFPSPSLPPTPQHFTACSLNVNQLQQNAQLEKELAKRDKKAQILLESKTKAAEPVATAAAAPAGSIDTAGPRTTTTTATFASVVKAPAPAAAAADPPSVAPSPALAPTPAPRDPPAPLKPLQAQQPAKAPATSTAPPTPSKKTAPAQTHLKGLCSLQFEYAVSARLLDLCSHLLLLGQAKLR